MISTSLFHIFTPVVYWLLIISWSSITVFYFRRFSREKRHDRLLRVLLLILCLDSLRTLIESTYFGIWFTSLSGLISLDYYNFLAKPQIVFMPKMINLVVSFLIIFIIIKKWIPQENKRLIEFQQLASSHTKLLEQIPISRLKAENELKKSEERFRLLYNNSLDMYVSVSPVDDTIIMCNDTLLKNIGYSREEVIGAPIFAMYHNDCLEEVKSTLQQFNKTGVVKNRELVLKRKDGSKMDVSLQVYSVKDEDGKILYSEYSWRDITERKHAVKKMRAVEGNLKSTFDLSPSIICKANLESGFFIEANQAVTRILGYSLEEFKSIPFIDLIHPDDQQRSTEIKDEQRNGKAVSLFENRYLCKDGSYKWIAWHGTQADNNGIVAAIGSDINQRKLAQIKLNQSTQLLEASQAVAKLGGWELELSTNNLFWTAESYRIYETSPDEFNPTMDAIIDNFLPESRIIISDALEAAKKEGKGYDLELEFYTAKKRLIQIRTTCKAIQEDGHPIKLMGIIQDITDIKNKEDEKLKLQTQLQQSQKMESVGRLAGGVAHDFNNMLGVILGHTDMLLKESELDKNTYESLEEIHKAGQRSAELTRQLLAFARKQTISPKILDLNQAVEGMLKMLRRLIGEDINLTWQPAKEEMMVNVDPSQIDQILANLCVNARDAINGVGNVIIETESATFDDSYCSSHSDSVTGEFVMLTVSDDGEGMEQEIKDKIFEPFYTTKGIGEGTGLGLSTIYGIIKQNNGFINVYSEPGMGSTFKVYLPRHTVEPSQKDETEHKRLEARGNETILLVEDEESMLRMTSVMLEHLGYTVVATNSPGKALQLVGTFTEPIHLLVTDVIMPEMNGQDLMEKLLIHFPNLNHLFMSGYTADIIAHQGVLDKGVNFIQKPFAIQELSWKVRDILDKAL